MWIVDSFASMVTGEDALYDVQEVPRDLYEATFRGFNSLISPWHEWLDPAVYRRHVDQVEAMGVLTVASAHGAVHTGAAIHAAFDGVRGLAGAAPVPDPGQPALDDVLAAALEADPAA
jgi:hypothetical protein